MRIVPKISRPWKFQGSVLESLPPAVVAEIGAQSRIIEVGDFYQIDSLDCVVFPLNGLISIRKAGGGPEVGSVGVEAGICSPIGDDFEAVTQTPSRLVCLRAPLFTAIAAKHFAAAELGCRCDDWLLHQARHLAACSATHSATRRVARFILRAAAAAAGDGKNVAPLSQDEIGIALGIRRTTVTLIAQGLQAEGIISYRRGKIWIQNDAALRAAACECHKIYQTKGRTGVLEGGVAPTDRSHANHAAAPPTGFSIDGAEAVPA